MAAGARTNHAGLADTTCLSSLAALTSSSLVEEHDRCVHGTAGHAGDRQPNGLHEPRLPQAGGAGASRPQRKTRDSLRIADSWRSAKYGLLFTESLKGAAGVLRCQNLNSNADIINIATGFIGGSSEKRKERYGQGQDGYAEAAGRP